MTFPLRTHTDCFGYSCKNHALSQDWYNVDLQWDHIGYIGYIVLFVDTSLYISKHSSLVVLKLVPTSYAIINSDAKGGASQFRRMAIKWTMIILPTFRDSQFWHPLEDPGILEY